MVRPFNTLSSGAELFQLSYAERLALWSLRQLIGQEPPRCASRATGTAWRFGDDLGQLDAAFRQALDELSRQGALHPQIDCCASLIVTGDEPLLLNCLASMQQDRHQAERPLEVVFPACRGRDLFITAMKALAAALAASGYWLLDLGALQTRSIASATRHRHSSNVQPVFA